MPRLEELIAEWAPRTTAQQRITAMRLHRQLKAEGYRVGRTLVGDYWRERRRQRAEVYVPLVNRPGEAQIELFEPDFARIGEGHDKGGGRKPRQGDTARTSHTIPRSDSLEAISRQLLADLDAAFTASELWEEERAQLLPVPATSFEVCKPIPVEISSRAMVRIEGAWYSVPSRWARLKATAYLGVDDVRITCMGENVTPPRARFGTRQVRYRHYLPELSRKPPAVRQVAPELIAELGAPWSGLWGLLCGTHGELEAARVVARLLGAVCEQGEDRVRLALEAAINQHRVEVPDLPAPGPKIDNVAVPEALAAYVVEAGRASDYDHLLLADGAVHE
jgi:hypothetical protein